MMNPGQLSADGKWQWDGAKWVPATQALAQSPAYGQAIIVRAAPTNSLAVVSLVSGILAWVLCPFVGAVVAVITGHVARSQIRTTGEAGGGMAVAGLVLGYVHLVTWVVGFFLWLVVLGGIALLTTTTSH